MITEGHTTLRIRRSTKLMLDSYGDNKASYEKIILKLIQIANNTE
jgi:hypothetical protein